MKKFLILMLALVLILGLAACGEKEPPQFDIPTLQAQSEAVIEALISGDYTTVTGYFDAEMSKQLSAEALGQTWSTVTATCGEYRSTTWGDEGAVQGYYQLRPLLEYELNTAQVALTWNAEGKLAGLYTSLRGNIKPVEDTDVPADAPYTEETVYVGSYDLEGKLTLPKGVEQPPVVLLIHGSGASDMDETIYGNKPFADIAAGLAERGIASLRYNKRTYAHPELFADALSMNIEAETLDDAEAAIEMLLADQRFSGVYVLGHSLGGMLVPYLGAENPELSGIISMAGSLRNLAEISYDQNVDLVEAMWDTLPADQQQLITQQLAALALQRDAVLALAADDGGTYIGIPAAYWVSLNRVDGSDYLAELAVPLLVLQGSADFQVYADVDYPLWQAELDAAEFTRYQMKLYDGLNHLFMPAKGYTDTTEYMTADHVDPTVIADIAAWILSEDK